MSAATALLDNDSFGFGGRIIFTNPNNFTRKKPLIIGRGVARRLSSLTIIQQRNVEFIPITLAELGFRDNSKQPFKSDMMSDASLIRWGQSNIYAGARLTRLEPEEILSVSRFDFSEILSLCWIQPNLTKGDEVLRLWTMSRFNRLDPEPEGNDPDFCWPTTRHLLFKILRE